MSCSEMTFMFSDLLIPAKLRSDKDFREVV